MLILKVFIIIVIVIVIMSQYNLLYREITTLNVDFELPNLPRNM